MPNDAGPQHTARDHQAPDGPAGEAERRLNALAPVDRHRLDVAQEAIEEARRAAERVRQQQGDDVDGEPAAPTSPRAEQPGDLGTG